MLQFKILCNLVAECHHARCAIWQTKIGLRKNHQICSPIISTNVKKNWQCGQMILLWYPPALLIRQRWTWTLLRFVITIWQGLKIVTTSTIASHLISTMLSRFSSSVCIRHALQLFASKAIIGAIASLSATPYLHLHHLIYTDTNTNKGKGNHGCKHW